MIASVDVTDGSCGSIHFWRRSAPPAQDSKVLFPTEVVVSYARNG